MNDLNADFVRGELRKRMDERLLRALDVGLDDERQRLDFALVRTGEEVGEVRRMLFGEFLIAVLALTEERDFTGLALVVENDDLVTRGRNAGKA